jgi:hypothetical protein
MTEDQISALLDGLGRGQPRGSAPAFAYERELAAEFIELHRMVLEDLWDDGDRLSDDRVPRMAGLLLKMFNAGQFPALEAQIGRAAHSANRMPDTWPLPEAGLYGQLWLADLLDAAWTVFRAYHAAMHRS